MPSPLPPEKDTPGRRVAAFFETYVHPLSVLLAAVCAVSGGMLLADTAPLAVATLHRVTSISLLLCLAVLVAVRRAALLVLLREQRWRPLTLCVLVAGLTCVAYLPPRGNPRERALQAMLHAPLADLAPVFGLRTDDLLARLTAAGARHPSEVQSLARVARANQLDPELLLALVTRPDDDEYLPEQE